MKASTRRRAAAACIAALSLLPCAEAWAQPVANADASAPRGLRGARVGEQALARQRGGSDGGGDTTLIKGSVADNQAVNVTTGGNLIAGGALAGLSGVPVVIQNSGNNVLIQSSTTVTVQLK